MTRTGHVYTAKDRRLQESWKEGTSHLELIAAGMKAVSQSFPPALFFFSLFSPPHANSTDGEEGSR